MNSLPVRVFHAFLSGAILATILCVLTYQLQTPARGDTSGTGTGTGETSGSGGNSPVPTQPPPINPTPEDLDGDGIPNAWEEQFHHDPNNSGDAGSDFDNDGLTAHEEYQLYQQTAGASGNPLGKWRMDELEIPANLGISAVWPLDINNRGQVLVQADVATDDGWHYSAFLVENGSNWTEIVPSAGFELGHISPYDLNDNSEVVGVCYSPDWTDSEPFIWDPDTGYRPFTFKGRRANAYKINNHGDWIGSVENANTGEWNPAFVVNGINQHAPGDWWPYLWYTDLNDYGEAMGSFYNAQTGSYNTLLAYGSWAFDTGLMGSLPVFDPDLNSYMWNSAMNAYGEFTGGSSGSVLGDWIDTSYCFDGAYHEILFAGSRPRYPSPTSINSSKTIVGYAADTSDDWRGFIYRDGVGLFLDDLLPGLEVNYVSRINEDGQLVAGSWSGTPRVSSPPTKIWTATVCLTTGRISTA